MFLFFSFKMANFVFVFVTCALFVVVVSERKGDPRFIEDAVDLTVAEGSNVTLPCMVENLGDYRILWFNNSYNQQNMHLSKNENVITKDPRVSVNKNYWLEIQNVKLEDSGQYLCYVDTIPARTQTRDLQVVGADEVHLIRSNQGSSVLSEKEIEDFTDSEYIPVVDKENITVTSDLKEDSSTKITPLSHPQSTLSPEIEITASNSEREFNNTLTEQSSTISEASLLSSEKTLSSSDDSSIMTKVTTEKFNPTTNEKQQSSTEDSNISNEISNSTSTDAPTSSEDSNSTSNVSTISDVISSTLNVSTISDVISSTSNVSTISDVISSTLDASSSTDDASSSSDFVNNKSDPNTVSGISISPTSGMTTSSEFSSTVTDLLHTNSDSTSTSDATPPVSKDTSKVTSSPTDLSSLTVISGKSTASTETLVSNTDITKTTSETSSKDILTTASSDKPEPNTEQSTTVTMGNLFPSSPVTTVIKTTSTALEITTEHLKHIELPGLKKIKLGLAITFLTVAVIAMAGIIIYMIKMRKPSIDYEELSLVP